MTKLKPIRTLLMMIAIAAMIGCGLGAQIFGQTQTVQPALNEKVTDQSEKVNDPYGINAKPEVAKNIGIFPQEGEFILKDITFTDEENRFVELGRYFDGKQPVMLSFNYSDCPKLCSVQLENMTWALRKVGFKVGKDFQVVSVSIDPNEQTSRARQTKAKYVEQYNQPGTEDGWHFLTGKQENIQLLADICGFKYKYVPEQKLYSHPPIFILVSPEGKLVRYIHGLDYDEDTIEQALIEAAEGKIGSPINILSYGLGCFTYNAATGTYTFQAMAIMRIGAVITVLILLITLVPYWFLRNTNEDKKKTGLPVPNASGT